MTIDTTTETDTETQGTTSSAEQPETVVEPAANTDAAEPAATEPDARNREAAKYRRQLREAEAATEQLRSDLETAHTERDQARAELARTVILGTTLRTVDGIGTIRVRTLNPSAYEQAGITPESLVDGDGRIAPAKVEAALKSLHDTSPFLFKDPRGLRVPTEGRDTTPPATQGGWNAAFGRTAE